MDEPSTKLTYYHLDGTQCVAGWAAETGECVKGGGAVMPRCFEGDAPLTVKPISSADHLRNAIPPAAADLHLSPRRFIPVLTPWYVDEQDNRIANRFND